VANPYVTDIERKTLENEYFRQVLYTGPHAQLVVMSLGPGEEIGAVVVPAGTAHNIINRSRAQSLKLYTIYSPTEHPDGTVHKTKAEADAYEREHHQS